MSVALAVPWRAEILVYWGIDIDVLTNGAKSAVFIPLFYPAIFQFITTT